MSQQQPTLFSFFKKASTPNSKPLNTPLKNQGFKSLDLVWAKLEGYPWWPALVYEHPVDKVIYKKKFTHVQFFDDPPTRGWVRNGFVKYYGTPESCGVNTYKDELWLKAKSEADEAQNMSHDERAALIVPMIPSDDEYSDESSFNTSEESKENVDGNIDRKKGKRSSSDSAKALPKSKKRKVVIASDVDTSEDEYKPMESESGDDSISSGVDEKLVSDIEPESESEDASPIKKTPKRSKNSSKPNVSFTPRSNFSNSPSASSSPYVSASTKSKLASFSATGTPSKTSSDDGDWPHLKLSWLYPENIRDKQKRKMNDPDYDPRTLYVPEEFINKQTPAMRQWWEIKRDHFDIVLFFKMGKFYELFHMDAIMSIQELGLLMMKGDYAHTGFPEISFGRYASLLVEKGYKVARIEQTETPDMMEKRCKNIPRPTKFDKVVKREVCQLLSRGTRVPSVMDSDITEENSNYLYTLTERESDLTGGKRQFGISFIDVSIGVFHLTQFEDDRHLSRLRTLFSQYPPSQALIEKGRITANALALIKSFVPSSLIDFLIPEKEFWDTSKTLSYLAESHCFRSPESGDNDWPIAIKTLLKEGDSLGLSCLEEYELCIGSLGGLIWYLDRCFIEEDLLSRKMFELYHPPDALIDHPAVGESSETRTFKGRFMILDGNTLRNLEVFENSFDGSTQGTLFETLNHCSTSFGKRLLHQWICNPLRTKSAIDSRLDAVEDLRANFDVVSKIKPLLRSLPDLERLLSKIHSLGLKRSDDHPDSRAILFENNQYSQRKVHDFLASLAGFQTSVDIIRTFEDICGNLKSSILKTCVTFTSEEGKFPLIQEDLTYFANAFDHDLAKKEGKIIPSSGVDAEFDNAIVKIDNTRESLDAYLKEQCKYFSAKVTYWGTDKKRYQLEVPDFATKRAGVDYELVSQKKGFKRYWTEETRSFLEEMQAAEEQRDSALQDIARRVFNRFGQNHVQWRNAVECIAVIDVLLSLTQFSLNVESARPTVSEEPSDDDQKPFLRILEGRHPCSIHLFSEGDFIPNDVVMADPYTQDTHSSLVLVTGPNMGGKSTLMRQTALICIMAQMGSYVPARECSFSIVDRIFTRIGASDRIYEGESTFLVELAETASIIRHATENSLVIVDELGRGTATYDGTAIAHSVVQELTRLGSRTLFSTHYHSLVDEFVSCDNISLGHMACIVEGESEEDPSQETVTFLYKFVKGSCPKSYGFNAARLAFLPESIIQNASVKARELEVFNKNKKMCKNIFNDPNSFTVLRFTEIINEMRSMKLAS